MKEEWKYNVRAFKTYDLGDSDTIVDKIVDSPEEAIRCWIEYSAKCPMETGIWARTKEDAEDLLAYSRANEEKIREMHARYGCPLKIDYMIDGIRKPLSGFLEWEYGDEVFPFCQG